MNRGAVARLSLLLVGSGIVLVLLGGCAARSTPPDPGDTAQTNATAPAASPIPPSATPESPPPATPPWQPALHTGWQWQLSSLPIDQAVDAQMYVIDLFDNDADVVAALHAQGRRVVCYVNVGAWEEWRPDARDFPPEVLGRDYAGHPGVKWLDIRRLDLLAPFVRNRLDLCNTKGFDGIQPDNLDGYANDTGFPLGPHDQIAFNIWLSHEAHARGLAIGLPNNPEQVADLLPYFDWALAQDCFAQGWCDLLAPFVAAGKAVFAVEYTDTGATTDAFCAQANALSFDAILKRRTLDAWREACP